MVGRCCPLAFCFHCASWVCHPNTRIHVRLLGPCFKTGRCKPFRQHQRRTSPRSHARRQRYPPTNLTYPGTCSPLTSPRRQLMLALPLPTRAHAGFHRFPLNNFRYFLTLFSKFFSSFPHGTCSLSVSRQYLALDEIYHPFRAAIPNNPTPRDASYKPLRTESQTGFSPSLTPCSKGLDSWFRQRTRL